MVEIWKISSVRKWAPMKTDAPSLDKIFETTQDTGERERRERGSYLVGCCEGFEDCLELLGRSKTRSSYLVAGASWQLELRS